MSAINSHELDRVHGGLFTSFFVIAVTTIFLSISLSVLEWIKKKLQMPRESVVVTDADITFKNGNSLSSDFFAGKKFSARSEIFDFCETKCKPRWLWPDKGGPRR